MGHCGAVIGGAQALGEGCIGRIKVDLVGHKGGPELEGRGALEEFADTLRILDAWKLDQDFARAADLLDVRLGNAEAVDTVTQDVERVADGALGLFLEDGDDLLVGGFGGDLLLELVVAENLGEAASVAVGLPSVGKEGDEIGRGVHIVGVRRVDGLLEVGIGGIAACEGLHQVFELHLQHHVHTALEVQTEVDFLLFDILEGVLEVHVLIADGIYISSVLDGRNGVDGELFEFVGNPCLGNEFLSLDACILGGLFLLDAGNRGEGQLPDAGEGDKNRYQSDCTFALHVVFIY